MRGMPPARAPIPAIRAIRAIVARCGILTPNSDIVATPRLPSAFITTTRQLPSRTFQSIAALLPDDRATQNDWAAGGFGVAVPGRALLSMLQGSIEKSRTRSIGAPAR